MRVECWALQTQNGLLKDHGNPFAGFKTRTFKTRREAIKWTYVYPMYRAKPVKIVLTVSVKDF